MKPKNDYKTLEKEYMTTNISVYALAVKHNISKSALARHATTHKWKERREKNNSERMDKVIQAIQDEQEDAFKRICLKSVQIFEKKLKQIEEDPAKCDMTYGQLMHTFKEMKDTGVFGMTVTDKKNLAEIKRIEKEIDAGENNVSYEISIDGGEDYAD